MNGPGKPFKPVTMSTRQILRDAKKVAKHKVALVDARPSRRPETRAECLSTLRPCLYVSCKFHLYLDVVGKGALKFNTPGEVADMWESCALDVAERGGVTLEDISALMNITRERVRQIQMGAIEFLQNDGDARIEEDL